MPFEAFFSISDAHLEYQTKVLRKALSSPYMPFCCHATFLEVL
jgi:hypothetical protein